LDSAAEAVSCLLIPADAGKAVIDYLVAENPLLKEQLDGRRLQLTDEFDGPLRFYRCLITDHLDDRLIETPSWLDTRNTPMRRHERLGGMLSYYRLAA
jgi:hypothetical protein